MNEARAPTDLSSADSGAPVDPDDTDSLLPEQALERVLPELAAVDRKKFATLNVDIPTVVARVLGCLPEITKLVPEMRALPNLDADRCARLRLYALALSQAGTAVHVATRPPDGLDALVAEGKALRNGLAADAEALMRHGVLPAHILGRLTGRRGYVNLATDLGCLAQVFRDHWSKAEGKCCTRETDLARAEQIADAVMRAAGARLRKPEQVAAAAELRLRALTVFVETYDQVRRAVQYLRWNQGDAETIAPSLRKGRGRKRRKGGTGAEEHGG